MQAVAWFAFGVHAVMAGPARHVGQHRVIHVGRRPARRVVAAVAGDLAGRDVVDRFAGSARPWPGVAGGAIARRPPEATRGMAGLALHLLVRRIEDEAGRIVVEAQGRCRLRKRFPPQPQHDRDDDEKDDEKTAQIAQRIVIRLN